MLFNVKFYKTISFNVVLGPNEVINMKNFNFAFIFAFNMRSLSHNPSIFF